MNEYINYFKNLVNQQKNISNYDAMFLRERNCIDSYTGDAKNYNAHFKIIKNNYPYSFSDYLVPEPFAGDISNAKIFCVMLNPALKGNEFIEQQDISFKNMLLNNINQNYDSDYPFWPLNPRFSNHDGFTYWNKKFDQKEEKKSLIKKLMKETNSSSVDDVKKKISKLFTTIELVPYHSCNYKHSIARELEAFNQTKKFIEECLIPRANKGEILLIFRGNKDNNIDLSKADMSKIVVVEPRKVQSFTFSCEKNVGSKIIEYIKKNKLM